jgi:hypothetical protein
MGRKKKIESDKSKTVKKRKVGRPKKRGRKKSYYTPKKKIKKVATKKLSKNLTYSRVRAVLWTNFKQDYPNYSSFISNDTDEKGKKIKGTNIVSKVYQQCKSLDCLDSDIIEIYLQFQNQNPNDEPPILPNDYYEPHYYWTLLTEDWWAGFDDRIWVVTPMLLTEPDNFLGILGSDRYVDKDGNLLSRKFDSKKGDYIISGKASRFNEFVDYCNQLQTQGLVGGSDDVPNWRFVGKEDDSEEVYWNQILKRWEIRIVICDLLGTIEDYGFNPNEADLEIDKDYVSEVLKKTKKQDSPIESPKEPIDETTTKLSKEELEIRKKELEQEDKRLQQEDERIKLEKEKSQRENERNDRINKLLQKYLDDKITTAEFERLLKLI